MSSMASFQVGDVVILKSGGEKMTVVSVENRKHVGKAQAIEMVVCTWFPVVNLYDIKSEAREAYGPDLKSHSFPSDALKNV